MPERGGHGCKMRQESPCHGGADGVPGWLGAGGAWTGSGQMVPVLRTGQETGLRTVSCREGLHGGKSQAQVSLGNSQRLGGAA